MKKSAFVFFMTGLLLVSAHTVFAQKSEDLFVPLEIQKAYVKSTRSKDGKPGPNYWQNRSDYKITVEMEPASRLLKGEETVTYYNNSNDTLTQIVVRLYPNIFKKGAARDEDVNPGDVTEGVTISTLQINDKAVELNSGGGRSAVRYTTTNAFIRLAQPLFPKNSVKLAINWSYNVPAKTHIREGMYGENTFMIAYWYPQIAVYDDIDGWDRLEYGAQTEFYNDFCNFDVTVRVPQNFLAWGTGVWQNPEQVLTPTFLTRYQNSKKSEEIAHIVTADDWKKGGITQSKSQLTYQFKAENVPDFAFAISSRYLWDATSAQVESSGRRTAISAVYDANSKDFYEVARFAKQSVEYFSTQMPGIPYPYPNLTVFNGSGGMEFPMFVNDGSYPLEEAAEVTAHEIAHTYMPFYMGINERKYAWMDEGFAQFLPNGIPFKIGENTFYPQQTNALYLASVGGREMEMPMMIPSNLLDNQLSYGFSSYFRPALAYATLENMLGKDKFKQVLNEYMRRWNGKHPMPYDFFFSFNDAAKEDLTWFWKPWFFERGYADLGIKKVETGKVTKITIAQNGQLPVPIVVTVTFTDGSTDVHQETARVWQSGAKEYAITKKYTKPIQKVVVGDLQVPDVNGRDNIYVVK